MDASHASGNPYVVISGAAGFIGRRLCPAAARRYGREAVLCLVWSRPLGTDVDGENILAAEELRTLEVDLVANEGLERVPRQPRRVFHLASSVETVSDDHRCNDVGTENLVEALAPLTADTHFVYVSTGAISDRRDDYTRPLTEDDPVELPDTEYARSKLRAERWLVERCARDGFRLTIVRLSTVWGAGPRPRSIFAEVPRMIRERSPITRADWPGLTSLVHAQDVADALVALAEQPPDPGRPELYLLAAEAVTLADISRELHGALGLDYRPLRLPHPLWATARALTRRRRWLAPLLPARARNTLWRASLIVDNVIWYDVTKVKGALPDWSPRRFAEAPAEVLE